MPSADRNERASRRSGNHWCVLLGSAAQFDEEVADVPLTNLRRVVEASSAKKLDIAPQVTAVGHERVCGQPALDLQMIEPSSDGGLQSRRMGWRIGAGCGRARAGPHVGQAMASAVGVQAMPKASATAG